MLPQYRTKTNLIITVIVLLAGLYAGICLSLPAKPGYSYVEWKRDYDTIYSPMIKENTLRHPLWWRSHVNEYTVQTIMFVETILLIVLMYSLYFAGNYIHGKEFGTAKYANPYMVRKMLRCRHPKEHIYEEKIERRWLPF